jgi:hypothetical protein
MQGGQVAEAQTQRDDEDQERTQQDLAPLHHGPILGLRLAWIQANPARIDVLGLS